MKPSPVMLGIGKLFWILFLDQQLGVKSTDEEKPCDVQLFVKRHSKYTVSAGESVDLECPVKYCAKRPEVTWCKLDGTSCPDIGDEFQGYMNWINRTDTSVFVLHFDQVHTSDNGSYRCAVNLTSGRKMESHSIAIYVTERTQNNSEYTVVNTTSTSEPPSETEEMDKPWIIYSLVSLGVLALLMVCLYLFCCLRRYNKGKQKNSSDTAGRENNLADIPQSFHNEQTEVGNRQNSQALPPETGVYDNEPWSRVQDISGIYSKPRVKESRQGIVYASLNHSVIGMNPREARHVREEPTEYAAICVRS